MREHLGRDLIYYDADHLSSVSKLAEMTAVGLDLPAEFFSDAGRYGFDSLSNNGQCP